MLNEKEALRKVVTELGFELVHYDLKTIDDLESAFAAGLRDDVSAFYISGEPLLYANLPRVMSFVTASRKPSVGPYPDWGRAGLLMSYATDPLDGVRHAGIYAAKILNGAKPRRSAHRTGKHIYFGDQSENRESTRHRRAPDLAGARRRGDRMSSATSGFGTFRPYPSEKVDVPYRGNSGSGPLN